MVPQQADGPDADILLTSAMSSMLLRPVSTEEVAQSLAKFIASAVEAAGAEAPAGLDANALSTAEADPALLIRTVVSGCEELGALWSMSYGARLALDLLEGDGLGIEVQDETDMARVALDLADACGEILGEQFAVEDIAHALAEIFVTDAPAAADSDDEAEEATFEFRAAAMLDPEALVGAVLDTCSTSGAFWTLCHGLRLGAALMGQEQPSG